MTRINLLRGWYLAPAGDGWELRRTHRPARISDELLADSSVDLAELLERAFAVDPEAVQRATDDLLDEGEAFALRDVRLSMGLTDA